MSYGTGDSIKSLVSDLASLVVFIGGNVFHQLIVLVQFKWNISEVTTDYVLKVTKLSASMRM